MRSQVVLVLCQMLLLTPALLGAEPQSQLRVRISWGHHSPATQPFYIKFLTNEVTVSDVAGQALEPNDRLQEGAWTTHAGGGDADAVGFTLAYLETPVNAITNLHRIWADLIAQSDPDTARRLRLDAAYRRDARKLTVQMDRAGTKGFSVTVDQMLEQKAFWVPALDVYLAAGDSPVSFADHRKQLDPWEGRRVLDQVQREPEATYEQYTARWEDMGHPGYKHPAQPPPGHIVGLAWDSAIPKFGIDRGGGVWNDYGNPDRFRFWFDFGVLSQEGIAATWQGQRLADGLPVITTAFEKNGRRYEVEQFAYPLNGPPQERRGDIQMVLLQKVSVTDRSGKPGTTSSKVTHRREFPASIQFTVAPQSRRDAFVLEESVAHQTLFSVEGAGLKVEPAEARDDATAKVDKKDSKWKASQVVVSLDLPANGSREFILKLPSPILAEADREKLLALKYLDARAATLKFWSDYLARGAQFRVPEKPVNDLFRAGLWHALRLPRRHGGQEANVPIDLPYSNFAYDQKGTPWPVNQAVYVDYMIYDLRGYHAISAEELLAIYRDNQQPNGRVGGYANWGVYTPSMMYTVAKNYLLSHDRPALDRLLPPTLKALDWCLAEIQRASDRPGPAGGLVRAPLNDGTGEGIWAFNQAYLYAGLDLLGKVLAQISHPRAQECHAAAQAFQQAVERGFGAATMFSPLVQLRDHTWSPYVPCEVLTPRRLLEQWYPTDVDTGAAHLLRLKALPAEGALADALLHDHEDNLFLKGWGMANEPVYNQQATAYLLRDDAKAVIRAFYSMMACAFSHSVFEPVEHRWTWGQYFGPPSTDGAWFELYRHILIHELDDDTLLLLQAAPREWLEDGKRIEVERAPSYYGELSMMVESQAAAGKLLAEIEMPEPSRPKILLVRLRHPAGKPLRRVLVNGQSWTDFDVQQEWVRIRNPTERHYSIVARY
ncbi:MAG: hypothetical protein AAB466_03740 [Verrucomicrobiota bacterium]